MSAFFRSSLGHLSSRCEAVKSISFHNTDMPPSKNSLVPEKMIPTSPSFQMVVDLIDVIIQYATPLPVAKGGQNEITQCKFSYYSL